MRYYNLSFVALFIFCSPVLPLSAQQELKARSPSVELKEVPQTQSELTIYPLNWARQSVGTTISALDPVASKGVDALLDESLAAEYRIPVGKHTIVVTLPGIEVLNKISFLNNNGIEGILNVWCSPASLPYDSPNWRLALKNASLDKIRFFAASLASSEAKYVRLEFDVRRSGSISGFGIFGSDRVADWILQPPPVGAAAQANASLVNYNYAKLLSHGRVVYVSSGQDPAQSYAMIDEDISTNYAFSSDDPAPTIILDFSAERDFTGINIVYDPQPGHFEIYALSEIPGQSKAAPQPVKPLTRQRPSTPLISTLASLLLAVQGASTSVNPAIIPEIKIPETFFAQNKPFQTVFDSGNGGVADLSFGSKAARYLMFRWLPANPALRKAFHIYEINLIGRVTSGYYTFARNPNAPGAGPSAPGEGPSDMGTFNVNAANPPAGSLPFNVQQQTQQQQPAPPQPPPVQPISP